MEPTTGAAARKGSAEPIPEYVSTHYLAQQLVQVLTNQEYIMSALTDLQTAVTAATPPVTPSP